MNAAKLIRCVDIRLNHITEDAGKCNVVKYVDKNVGVCANVFSIVIIELKS